MYDLGFDVPRMTEHQNNMDILLGIFDEEEVQSIEYDADVSTSNREVLQELDQAFMPERTANSTPPNPFPRPEKRFNTVWDEELQELKENRQSLSTRKNT